MTLDCTSTAGGVIDISTDYGPAPDGGYPSLSVSVNYGPNEQSAVPNADGIYTAQVSYDNATFSHIVVGFTDDPNRYLAYQDFEAGACDPEPTPTPTPTQTTTPSPTPTPTETVTPTPEPTPSPTFSPSPTASPTDTPSPTPSATPISVPSPSSTPSTPVLAVTGIDPVASSVGGGVGALLLAAGIAVVLFVRRRRNA
uniref:hypothetical protein n=1 Tax=Microbacterium proteolyticum TaxID=1572644 RepID=UPI0024172515|nr:hypothetical protein [Microbacterium proteolyticum]